MGFFCLLRHAFILFFLGISSVAVSIRCVLHVFSVTQSQRLFTVGLAMAIAAVGIVCSALNGSPLLPGMNLEWAWYFGTSIGFLFLVVGSLMTTEEQIHPAPSAGKSLRLR